MKIKLIESKRLNEAFSASMPKWLKEKLLRDKTAWEIGSDYYQNRDRYAANAPAAFQMSKQQRDKYISQGYALDKIDSPIYAARGKHTNLYGLLIENHFNLSSAIFITPNHLPKNSKDPIVNAPNIPIWLVPSSEFSNKYQVYMKGFNDDELWRAKNQKFAYASVKQLNEACEGFCYVDGSALNTFDTDKVQTRKEFNLQNIPGQPDSYYRYFQGNIPNEYLLKNEANRILAPAVLDKSGYAQIPTATKYAKKLMDMKANNAAAWLESCYNTIMQCKNDFADFLYNMDAKEDDEIESSRVVRILNDYKNCVKYYKTMCNIVDTATDKEIIKREFERFGTASHLDTHIESLRRETSRWKTVIADWD